MLSFSDLHHERSVNGIKITSGSTTLAYDGNSSCGSLIFPLGENIDKDMGSFCYKSSANISFYEIATSAWLDNNKFIDSANLMRICDLEDINIYTVPFRYFLKGSVYYGGDEF